jgi:hypothetical protein
MAAACSSDPINTAGAASRSECRGVSNENLDLPPRLHGRVFVGLHQAMDDLPSVSCSRHPARSARRDIKAHPRDLLVTEILMWLAALGIS